MRTVVAKGKNIEEAIRNGLKKMNADRQEVDVEVIQRGSPGLLGIGAKPAIVKLFKKETTETMATDAGMEMQTNGAKGNGNGTAVGTEPLLYEESQCVDLSGGVQRMDETVDRATASGDENGPDLSGESAHDERVASNTRNLDGTVWIQNGQLYFKSSQDHEPSVSIGEHIILLKNGVPVSEKNVTLSEGNEYALQITSDEQKTVWKITFDQKKLKALLYVEPGYVIHRKIRDIAPARHLKLVVEEKKEVINHLTIPQVVDKLKDLWVRQGLNYDEITKATHATEPGTYEVATGIEPENGKDGWLELLMEVDAKDDWHVDESGRVNFKEHRTIPMVESGQVIAVIHPPISGKPGLTVTNEPLPPNPTRPLLVKLGPGVTQEEDKIVATVSGHPKVKRSGLKAQISITQKIIHKGDVDLASGNIRFKGDVEIQGGIKDGMVVEAAGDILVQSTISFAKLIATGSIMAQGNVISSELTAGKNMMIATEVGRLLKTIEEQVEKLVAAVKQLVHASILKRGDFSNHMLPASVHAIMERKFQGLIPQIKQYNALIKKHHEDLDEQWKDVAASLEKVFLVKPTPAISLQNLEALLSKLKNRGEWDGNSYEADVHITVNSVQNSKLYSSGDIMVVSTKGCVNSQIHAGGRLKINGTARGGELYGASGADIDTVGSEIGITTVIAVPSGQTIKIKKAMEGTVLKIGSVQKEIKETTYNIHARLKANGDIAIN